MSAISIYRDLRAVEGAPVRMRKGPILQISACLETEKGGADEGTVRRAGYVPRIISDQ